MLAELQKIVQEVSASDNLDDALALIVNRVQGIMQVDAVSIYLAEQAEGKEEGKRELVLRATHGLNEKSIGRIRLAEGEGLVGQVAERAEPLNLDDAASHERFRYFPDSGEALFHSFLGVPIVNFGEVHGVLVVQQRTPRLFDEDHIAFLLTLAAQIGGAISLATVSQEVSQRTRATLRPRRDLQRIKGLPGSSGLAIGNAVVVCTLANLDTVPDRVPRSISDELAAFDRAIQASCEDMRRIGKSMREVLPSEEAALFDAYEMMLDGGPLIDDTIKAIKAGNWAQGAFRKTIQAHAKIFLELDDAYLRERAEDIKDLGRRVLMHLQEKKIALHDWPRQTILVGEDISPTQLAEVPADRLAGIVSVHGSGSSHVAILARAMQIPAVMGATDIPLNHIDGLEIVVDGYAGHIVASPGWALKREYGRLIKQERQQTRELSDLADKPAVTKDGVRINLLANTGLISDVTPCLQSGAEGIGLYRTEIPFQIRDRFPSEEEQYDIYHQVLASFAPRPVVIRSLDVGGDKPLDYFPINEDNPFLGWRGIRISLDHPELFLNQVRAMLKANHGLGNMRILLPMISSMHELQAAKKLIAQAHAELQAEDYRDPLPKIGVMIEVPSLIYLMDVLVKHVDFFSIGTNDLTQYLLAVDRNNERVASLYNALHPAVLHAILAVVESAKRHAKPVSVCGELAGDPLGALCLMGMGVHSLSMSAGSLLRVKKIIRSFSSEQSQDIVSSVLALEDGNAVRDRLREELEKAGLGGLIRPGK
ncbi:MAG: phosphoenolpyruvate--protein phosphotransferase [Gammaproteobacteria bacterium]|nr:MAG: phosphoenolpyruvate--protein phosphotransferase [Gammaproteobacteria bacterium]